MKASHGNPISAPIRGVRQDLTMLGRIQALDSGLQVCLVAEGGRFPNDPELPDPGHPGEWRRVKGFISGCIYPYGGTGLYAWVPRRPTSASARARAKHDNIDRGDGSLRPELCSVCAKED